jgi:hypothetical protein
MSTKTRSACLPAADTRTYGAFTVSLGKQRRYLSSLTGPSVPGTEGLLSLGAVDSRRRCSTLAAAGGAARGRRPAPQSPGRFSPTSSRSARRPPGWAPRASPRQATIGLGWACQAGIARIAWIAALTPAGRRPLPCINVSRRPRPGLGWASHGPCRPVPRRRW